MKQKDILAGLYRTIKFANEDGTVSDDGDFIIPKSLWQIINDFIEEFKMF